MHTATNPTLLNYYTITAPFPFKAFLAGFSVLTGVTFSFALIEKLT